MRKFYLFAIAAVAVCMASCGNKAGNAAGEADSTATTEQVAEAPSTFAETDFFSVTGPEGWEIKADNNWDSSKEVEMEDVNSTEVFKPKIEIKVYKDKKMQDEIDKLLKHADTYKKGADLKIGDFNFTTVRGSNKLNYCYAELEGGRLLEVETVYMDPEAEVVKPVVESIKIK